MFTKDLVPKILLGAGYILCLIAPYSQTARGKQVFSISHTVCIEFMHTELLS